jgi:hypothetical protein
MASVTFTGSVTPPVLLLKIEQGPFTWTLPPLGDVVTTFSVEGALVRASCEMAVVSDETATMARLHILALISGVVDSIAFVQGYGVAVILDRCEMPDGKPGPVGLWDENLKDACSVTNAEIMKLAEKEPEILLHVHDLVQTILRPWDAPLRCARAVEGFRTLMCPFETTANQWVFMREKLNLSQGFTELVARPSSEPGYNALKPVKLKDVAEIRLRAWIVADRFLQFRRRGNIDLPQQEFRLL